MAKKRKKNRSKTKDFFDEYGGLIMLGLGGAAIIAVATSATSAYAYSEDNEPTDVFDFFGDGGSWDLGEVTKPVEVSPKTAQEAPAVAKSGTNKGADLVESAKTLIGTEYGPDVGGPTRAGFEKYLDCSGTIFQAARRLGITIPRNATGQYLRAKAFRMLDEETAKNTAGALVFFHKPNTEGVSAFHVELSLGDGRVLHNHQPDTRVEISKWGWWRNWIKRKGYTVSFGVLPEFAA